MKKRLKINGVIIFLAMLLLALFPGIFFRGEGSEAYITDVLEILGIACILMGQLVRVSARGYKAEHSGEGTLLIEGGPYGVVRNPMYLGILLIGLGVVFMLFRLWVSLVFIVVFVVRYIVLIFTEEKKLFALFPGQYKEYCHRVPRIVPHFSVLVDKDVNEYLPLRLSWIRKEIGSIWVVLVATLLVETGEDIFFHEGWRVYLREAFVMLLVVALFVLFGAYLSRRTVEMDKKS